MNGLNVYFNGRFLSQKTSGTQRFAECILKGIDKIIDESELDFNKYFVVCESGNIRNLGLTHIKVIQAGLGQGHIWEQTTLPWISRDGLLVNLINSGPILHSRQIVTFHDASIYDLPHLFAWKYRCVHLLIRGILARRAKRIITVSPYSRKRFESIYHADDKMVIVPNGCDHVDKVTADEEILERHKLSPKGYILCVGNASRNKNLITAYRAWKALPVPGIKLVAVGAVDKKVFGSDASLATEAAENEDVHFLTGVSDEELVALYSNAALFLFPSLYEGFGIPPLEAMRLGCPVVATRAAAVPDTVGEAAVLIDPLDVPGISAALYKVLSDESLREELIKRGNERAGRFTWNDSSSALYNTIRDLS